MAVLLNFIITLKLNFSFIDVLRKRQKIVDADYAKFVQGSQPPKKQKKYREADARILNLVNQYVPINNDANFFDINRRFNQHTIIEFLRGISRNYHMD